MIRIWKRIATLATAAWWTPYKALAVLAGVGLGEVLDSERAPQAPHTTLFVIVGILAGLDAIAWWLSRYAAAHRTFVLTATHRDGTPYRAPWGEDEGIEVTGTAELEERVATVVAAGLVPNVRPI